jgi:hypothetical protein
MTREQAATEIRALVAGLDEHDETLAVERLLEAISVRDDAAELRAALVEMGGRHALRVLRSMPGRSNLSTS